jgi:hypothetical protein
MYWPCGFNGLTTAFARFPPQSEDEQIASILDSKQAALDAVGDCSPNPAFALTMTPDLADHHLEKHRVREAALRGTVSLDLSSNQLTSFTFHSADDTCATFCWLRSLNLSGNTVSMLDRDLSLFLPVLQVLDLSFNEGLCIKTPSVLRGLKHLLILNLEGCNLSSLDCEDGSEGGFLQELHALQVLKLGENGFETLESLEHLKHLKSAQAGPAAISHPLKEFDCRDNEVANDNKGYRKWILDIFPNLEMLDNTITNTTSQIKSLGDVKGLKDAVGRCDTLADAAEGSDKCSCLEGVPCEEKYKCEDWENRFLEEEDAESYPLPYPTYIFVCRVTH